MNLTITTIFYNKLLTITQYFCYACILNIILIKITSKIIFILPNFIKKNKALSIYNDK